MGYKNSNLLKFIGLFLIVSTVVYGATVGNVPKHIIFKGLNTRGGPLSLDDGESPQCMNVHASIFGTLVKRAGYTKESYSHVHITTNPGVCNGIFDFAVDTDTRETVAYYDTKLYAVDSSVPGWKYIEFTSAMSNDIMEFENLDGTLIMTTWSQDLPQSWDGTATTTSDITNMPKGKHVIQAYTRIFTSNIDLSGTVYPLRFYFSNAGSYSAWTTSTDYETLDAPSGDEAMGWGLLKGRLFGFTKYTINLISDVGGSSPMQVTKRVDGVGCGAPRTIKTVNMSTMGESLMWLSQDKKLYAWNGSSLKEISLNIDTSNNLSPVYMQAINDTNLKYCHAQVLEKKGWYVLFIPITTYIDYAVVYDYNTGTLWAMSNQTFWSSATIESTTSKDVYVGERNGQFHKWNDGVSDDGTSIGSYWISRRFDFGFMPVIKKMGEVQIVTKTLGNYPLYYQYRYNFNTSWTTQKELTMVGSEWLLGQVLPATLGGNEAQVHRLTIPGAFNLFQVKLTDDSSNPSWEVYALDLVTNATGSVGD